MQEAASDARERSIAAWAVTVTDSPLVFLLVVNLSRRNRVPIIELLRSLGWFMWASLVVMALITCVPQLALRYSCCERHLPGYSLRNLGPETPSALSIMRTTGRRCGWKGPCATT
jgi:hypothetical protein